MAVKSKGAVLTIPVNFGNVSIGDKTARIGVNVERQSLTLGLADKSLVEKRLVGTISGKPRGDKDGQGRLEGMEDDCQLEGTFDVKGISVSRGDISFGLTFLIGDIDVSELARFAKRTGELCVDSVEALPEPEKSEDNE